MTLSAVPLPPGLREQIPQGPQRKCWLVGCALFSHTLSLLPEIIYGEQGKPVFTPKAPPRFNLGHSGDDITLLLSDEDEVGCNIEVICPCANRHWLTNAVFDLGEHIEMDAVRPGQQLEILWRIWTRKEAIVKQCDGSVWQIVSVDSTYNSSLSVSHCQLENLSLAICTPTLLTLTAGSVQWVNLAN